jgi:hypothetical protein
LGSIYWNCIIYKSWLQSRTSIHYCG